MNIFREEVTEKVSWFDKTFPGKYFCLYKYQNFIVPDKQRPCF